MSLLDIEDQVVDSLTIDSIVSEKLTKHVSTIFSHVKKCHRVGPLVFDSKLRWIAMPPNDKYVEEIIWFCCPSIWDEPELLYLILMKKLLTRVVYNTDTFEYKALTLEEFLKL